MQVLPLVDGQGSAGGYPGWCVYEYTLKESPEIEFICGGINTKMPDAVGVWRQGNLMHFGFEETPSILNDAGDAMLVNAIHYIARFTEDRPILRAPSPFAGSVVRTDADRDLDAQALGVKISDLDSFRSLIPMLSDDSKAQRARTLLERHAPPQAPEAGASADTWDAWFEEYAPCLFYSQWGGSRWYIDPLARKRGVSTSELRGAARADRE